MAVIQCWNCGKEGHSCNDCRKPKDQAAIDAAKKKWEADKASRSTSGGGGGKIKQQQRKKWGTQDISGIHWSGSTPHAFCNKSCNGVQCGWNTTHSSKYLKFFAANPATFKLVDFSPNHPLVMAQRGSATSTTTTVTDCSSLTGGSGKDHVLVNKNHAADVLEKLERNSASHETVEIVGALRTLFSLN